jgi:hypothetical protein
VADGLIVNNHGISNEFSENISVGKVLYNLLLFIHGMATRVQHTWKAPNQINKYRCAMGEETPSDLGTGLESL